MRQIALSGQLISGRRMMLASLGTQFPRADQLLIVKFEWVIALMSLSMETAISRW